MKRSLKILSCAMALAVGGTVAATFGGCSKGNANTFTMWVSPNSALLEQYQDLSKNPVMQYVSNKFDIKLEFIVPSSGSEADQFTTLTTDPDCPDIMDLSFYSGGMYDLVEDGVALDLTSYIYPTDGRESYFPNYAKVLDGDLDLKNSIRTLDNKYYSLYTIDDEMRNPWGGFMYRKDLVLKYAKADDAEGEANPATWTTMDDIVFPSEATAPDLLSDYDWMFKILKRAVDAGEINYVTSMFYKGYVETGDIISAWGVSGSWYKEVADGKTTVKYGANTEAFKSYMQHMNEWWKAGYIDSNFSSRTQDMFFAIDPTSYPRGKVGCFYGTDNLLGNALGSHEGVDSNIELRAGYTPRLTKDSEPISFYGGSRTNKSFMITTNVLDKNYDKLFAALDYLYSEEGAIMTRLGLNKEQYAEIKADGAKIWDAKITLSAEEMQIAGVTSAEQYLSDIGMYHYDETLGKNVYWNIIETKEDGYESCASAMSFWGMSAVSKMQYVKLQDARKEAYEIWSKYDNKGFIDLPLMSKKLSKEDNYEYTTNYNSIDDYMSAEVPKFIKGSKNFTSDWNKFCDTLLLKGCNKNTKYLQSMYDKMEGRS